MTATPSLVRAQGEVPETVREHYAVLPHKAGECVQCGACESRCPFGVAALPTGPPGGLAPPGAVVIGLNFPVQTVQGSLHLLQIIVKQ